MHYMNSTKIARNRSRPLLLILLLSAAICWSTLFELASSWIVRIPGLFAYLIYLSPLFAFPFSMTCVVWLAGRSGGTGRATWTVPLILLAAELLVGITAFLVISIIETGGFPNVRGGDVLHNQWTIKTRALLFSYVFLAFLFRASTLHLRPKESKSFPNRLTVLSILGLTTLVAMGLGIDAVMNLASMWRLPSMVESSSLSHFYFAIAFFHQLMTALIWFSAAWLLVANNSKRWIGWIGLVAHLVMLGVYFFAILPEFIRLQSQASGVTLSTIGFYYWGHFAISVLQIAIVFFCVGIMHLVGNRWDIRRRLPTEGFVTPVDSVPPVLELQTENDTSG